MTRDGPKRLLDECDAGEASSLGLRALAAAARREPWPMDRRAALYWAVKGHTRRNRSYRPPAFAFGALFALALAALLIGLRSAPSTPPPATATPAESLQTRFTRTGSTAELTPYGADRGAAGGATSTDAPRWMRIDLDELGTVETSADAHLTLEELDTERVLHLRSGTLRAEVLRQDPNRPVVVTTPQLRIVVVGTRLDVQVRAGDTLVDLIEGAVRVERHGVSLRLRSGESVGSDDPRLREAGAPPTPSAFPAPSEVDNSSARSPSAASKAVAPGALIARCEMRPTIAAKESCFQQISRGDGLLAQDALFRLGQLARSQPGGERNALRVLREYSRRFPSGLLATEAALQELGILSELGEWREVVERAARFEERFALDPRADEVAFVRASTLCARLKRPAAAQLILDRLSREATAPDIRKAARTLRLRCGPQPDPDSGAHPQGDAARPSDASFAGASPPPAGPPGD